MRYLFILTILLSSPAVLVHAEEQVALAGIFDLSGAGSIWGKAERNAFLLAIKDFESSQGSKVRYSIEDSAYSNSASVTAWHKLTSVDGYNFIVGPTWEPFAAVMPLCESKQVICIAPSCNTGAFEDPKLRYSFTVWFDDRDYAAVHAEALNTAKFSRIGLIAAISPFYDGLVGVLQRDLTTAPVFIERVQPDEQNFRSIIAKLPSDLDGLIIFLLGDGAAQAFYKQWAELRKDRPHIFTDDAVLYMQPKLDLAGLKLKISYSAPDFSNAHLENFNKRYQGEYGEAPGAPSASAAYDATRILLACISRSASEVDQVRSCISNTVDYPGHSGTLSFDGARGVKQRKMKVYELR